MKKTIFLMSATLAVPAFAGTAVLGGDAMLTGATGATLAQNEAGTYARFTSSGGTSAVLDWSSFNVGANKEMNFSGAGTTFFNLVDAAASKSQIDGIISGNGSVWVINPNGIAFGASSQVNVGGLFAAAAGKPVFQGLPFGHEHPKCSYLCGTPVEIRPVTSSQANRP